MSEEFFEILPTFSSGVYKTGLPSKKQKELPGEIVSTTILYTAIGEKTDDISDKGMWHKYERRHLQQKSNRQKQKHNHDFDMNR